MKFDNRNIVTDQCPCAVNLQNNDLLFSQSGITYDRNE